MTRFKPKHVRQFRKTWCAYACICSILEMNGEDDQIKIKIEFNPKQKEPSGHEIIEYLKKKGCEVKCKGRPRNIDEIEKNAQTSRIMLFMDSDSNPHVMVYSKHDSMGVHVMDPAVDKDERKTIRREEFLRRVNAYIVIQPT